MNSIFYFIFSFSSLISFVQFFIWKTDISIALITERYNRSFVDYPVGILWKFFYRNMWKLISCCLHTYYLKILLQKYVEISCCLHTYRPKALFLFNFILSIAHHCWMSKRSGEKFHDSEYYCLLEISTSFLPIYLPWWKLVRKAIGSHLSLQLFNRITPFILLTRFYHTYVKKFSNSIYYQFYIISS